MKKLTPVLFIDMAAVVLLGPGFYLMTALEPFAWRLAVGLLWGICLARAFGAVLRSGPAT